MTLIKSRTKRNGVGVKTDRETPTSLDFNIYDGTEVRGGNVKKELPHGLRVLWTGCLLPSGEWVKVPLGRYQRGRARRTVPPTVLEGNVERRNLVDGVLRGSHGSCQR